MRKSLITFLFLFFVLFMNAQMPWTYVITGTNHTILVQEGTVTIGGFPIEVGDYIAAFYDDAGTLVCGGYTEWTGDPTAAVSAWGDDASTTNKDGFSSGEVFTFKVWRASDGVIIDMTATYSSLFPNLGTYITNGMSGILTMIGSAPVQSAIQTIPLPNSWSIFSTYLIPVQPNIAVVTSPILPNLSIVKDWNGQSYWPQYGLNLIGDVTIGYGYQIKMTAADTLDVDGFIIQPDTTILIVPVTWSILGYIRTTPASIVDMLNPIFNNIVIVKDRNGQAYWPMYSLNLIGDMQPGQGYAIKMLEQDTLIYPVNAPFVITDSIINITKTTAVVESAITSDGGAYVTTRGVCWNTIGSPDVNDSITADGTGVGPFASNLSSLEVFTNYYVRSYATNTGGTAYGNELTFITLADIPTVITGAIANITGTSASCTNEVTGDGGNVVTVRGVCWNTSGNPTTAENITIDGSGVGTYISNVINLSENNVYYLRAFAINNIGVAYGEEIQFTTLINLPSIITGNISAITQTSAICGGEVTADGGASITARGVCWNTTNNPTISDNFTTDGTGTGAFISNLTGLSSITTYYVRAYATNSMGTSYGSEVQFTTLAYLPTVITDTITNIMDISATGGGIVINDGGATVTELGICWSTITNPTITDNHTTDGSGTGAFVSSITGLTENTVYYVRAYATNSIGTAYGDEVQFSTLINLPSVTTGSISGITQTEAFGGGVVTSDGGDYITARGVCWNTANSPTTADSFTTDATGAGAFISNLTGLSSITTYYVRAYATNSMGTSYGNVVQFTTLAYLPTVITDTITSIMDISAAGGGTVINNGGATVTALGICWSTISNPIITDNHTTDGSGIGAFVSSITGLTENTVYYVRAYAINSIGTAYGDEVQFATITTLPIITTSAITSITDTSAICGGDVVSEGITNVLTRGICWNMGGNPLTTDNFTSEGSGIGVFASNLEGLAEYTTYYVRAYAVCVLDTVYGAEILFTTESNLPIVTTSIISYVTDTTATGGGEVITAGMTSVITRGVCWNNTGNPTTADSLTSDSTGIGVFTSNLTDLSADTMYYVRAYATYSNGTAYGNENNFTTLASFNCGSQITDYDGNNYNTILIGTQCWMQENLKVTHYTNGTAIPNVTGSSAWADLLDNNTDDAYCYYDNSSLNANIYGALYTWAAAMGDNAVSSNNNQSGVQGACQTGWHIPSDNEWKQLEMELGMSQIQANLTYYRGTNQGSQLAGNSLLWDNGSLEYNFQFGTSGFTALPGGNRYNNNGLFNYLGESVIWWSSTENDSWDSWCRLVYYYYPEVNRNSFSKSKGIAVRCLMDSVVPQPTLPTVTTNTIIAITETTATGGGEVITAGMTSVITRGVCWNNTGSPTTADSLTNDSTGLGLFTSNLTGLSADTVYYVRAYATNSTGTAYGNEQIFTTNPVGSNCGYQITDYDGNNYNTVLIGTQCWMSENLTVTHYTSGIAIPHVTLNSSWTALGSNDYDDAYCYYSSSTCGKLYTWAAAMGDNTASSSSNPSGVQGACPISWHLPSDNEWKQLEIELGMSQSEADDIEYRGTNQGSQLAGNSSLWSSGNLENNSQFGTSGFTALPGGSRNSSSGFYSDLGNYGFWWSSTEDNSSTSAWRRLLGYGHSEVYRSSSSKSNGFSVRCLKD